MRKEITDLNYITCPVCKNDTPVDGEHCLICGAELTSPEPEEELEWEIVRTVSTVIEAELMAGRLRSHGIPAIVLSQVDSTRSFTVGGLAIAKVFVPTIHFAEATQILATDADQMEEDGEGEHE
ncbi:MAG: DUF2007 domain-containing protein [Ignavibacteriae bacterium]|nr:DUF2007 domain-containing protein [Ignavibacteriota bacterium]MCB9216877.1 DUF2007 domain-containing protein [Ignavibacteria bacterium]